MIALIVVYVVGALVTAYLMLKYGDTTEDERYVIPAFMGMVWPMILLLLALVSPLLVVRLLDKLPKIRWRGRP